MITLCRITATLALSVLLFPCATASAQTATLPDNPHVVMIFTDDMGYGDISSFANTPLSVRTPNIDRLATEGMKFTQFYVAMPICSPSRAAVLSGRFSPENQLTNYLQMRSGNSASDQNDYMDPELAHLPRSFQSAGYATAHVGKWHLGGGRDVDNAPAIGEYGYDEFYSTWESPNPDPSLGVQNAPWNETVEPGQVVRWKRTEYMVDRTLDFMQRHPGKPCFVTLWPDDLHTPFWPSPEMLAKYGGSLSMPNSEQNFYGVLEEYDRQIGRLLDGLEARGLAEDTIIFFTGDNGPAPDLGRRRTDGLRGRKLSLYEGGVRQPFVIRWPGHIPAGAENTQTILSAVDLLPTLTSLAGIDVPAEALASADGEDLSQAMLGTPVLRTNPLMWEYGRNSSVPRPGTANHAYSPTLAVRSGDYKLLVNHNGSSRQLYNVRQDPNEATNVATQFPALAQQLADQVIAWSMTLPHRSHPYPVFSTVNFNTFAVSQVLTAAQLQAAADASSTARIDGVAVDAHGDGDIYLIHTDTAGKETFLSFDPTTNELKKITDSGKAAAELGAFPPVDLNLVGGFDYASAGNRLFFAETSLGLTGQALMISVDVGTGLSRLLTRTTNLGGITDHTVRPDATLAVSRGEQGNSTIGTLSTSTGGWTQRVTEAQLIAASPGTSNLPPEAITANSSSGAVLTFAGGDGEVFSIGNIAATPPALNRLAQPALQSASFTDLTVDQAGNMFGIDTTSGHVVVVSAGGTVFSHSFSSLANAIGSGSLSVPATARTSAARMARASQSDLFIASDGGLICVRFGAAPAAVNDWTLY